MSSKRYDLRAFEKTPSALQFLSSAELGRSSSGLLQIKYRLLGPLEKLKIPMLESRPHFKERLWQTTCFEAFVSGANSSAYRELNFSPSKNWWAADFDSYRKGSKDKSASKLRPPEIVYEAVSKKEAVMAVRLSSEWTFEVRSGLEWGLCVILELLTGEKIHFALEHLKNEPDFHLRESFKTKT